MRKVVAWFTAAAGTVFATVAASAECGPPDLQNFEESFVKCCRNLPHRRADIESFGGGDREMDAYCHCVGAYFARVIHSRSRTPTLDEHVSAFKICVAKVFGRPTLELLRERFAQQLIVSQRKAIEEYISENKSAEMLKNVDLTRYISCTSHFVATQLLRERDIKCVFVNCNRDLDAEAIALIPRMVARCRHELPSMPR